jgi:hypothetical protein
MCDFHGQYGFATMMAPARTLAELEGNGQLADTSMTTNGLWLQAHDTGFSGLDDAVACDICHRNQQQSDARQWRWPPTVVVDGSNGPRHHLSLAQRPGWQNGRSKYPGFNEDPQPYRCSHWIEAHRPVLQHTETVTVL